MKLENLKDFEWYNEPENVFFKGEDMHVLAMPQTDFWQNTRHGVSVDNGHFFYKTTRTDFTLVLRFRFENADKFSQCGLMIRYDKANWFKVSLMSEDSSKPEIGHCLTAGGNSDWANLPLHNAVYQMWYKLVRRGSDFVAYYSLDGENFLRLRQFVLMGENLKTGAYIASPQQNNFEVVLEEIVFC